MTGSLREPLACVQPPARILGSDEQPEASNVDCDYIVGPRPWKNWLVFCEHSRSCKGGCQDCYAALSGALKLGRLGGCSRV
jgi:hypothetical protein